MPPWFFGVGAVIIALIRRPLLAWLFGLVKREAGYLLRSYGEERFQRDAEAARAAQRSRSAGHDGAAGLGDQ